MAVTYSQIATQTLGSAASSVTFSSIPQTYTDLVLVINGGGSSAGENLLARFNSDTGTNYSQTILNGNGTTARSTRESNANYVRLSYYNGFSNTLETTSIASINNYANATTYKTVLARNSQPSGSYSGVDAIVSLWRSTAAINTILLFCSSGNLLSGSTFSLYGIKAA